MIGQGTLGLLTPPRRRLSTWAGGAMLAAWAPAAHSLAPRIRPRFLPTLCGVSQSHQIALTFDDGPDATATPELVRLLAEHGAHATFFLLGRHVEDHRSVVELLIDHGHDLGVHGWDHWPTLVKAPTQLRRELERTLTLVEAAVGVRPRWYRPPFGILTTEALVAARRLGLQTVLWSAWGRDWTPTATPRSVVRAIGRDARPGGTVLLHDSDRASARDSWRTTYAATDVMLTRWRADGIPVGSLATHDLALARRWGQT